MKKPIPKTAPTTASATTVACPQCGVTVVWTSASHWKPFCSKRCKLLDLGAWANESYRVAGDEIVDVSELENTLTAFPSDVSSHH